MDTQYEAGISGATAASVALTLEQRRMQQLEKQARYLENRRAESKMANGSMVPPAEK